MEGINLKPGIINGNLFSRGKGTKKNTGKQGFIHLNLCLDHLMK
jgi:hypothetical protein